MTYLHAGVPPSILVSKIEELEQQLEKLQADYVVVYRKWIRLEEDFDGWTSEREDLLLDKTKLRAKVEDLVHENELLKLMLEGPS